MALHAPQVHGFFSVPVDHLHALTVLADHFRAQDLKETVVVAPDLGRAREAAHFARLLKLPVVAGSKRRLSDTELKIDTIVGDITGSSAIIADDEIATGGTVLNVIARLRERGVKRFSIACTHGVFSGTALELLGAQPDIIEIVTTDTVPLAAHRRPPNLHVLTVAPVLAETIRRIHRGESVSSLFTEPGEVVVPL
jgi:ribose-phosphate pyrophosphokinase